MVTLRSPKRRLQSLRANAALMLVGAVGLVLFGAWIARPAWAPTSAAVLGGQRHVVTTDSSPVLRTRRALVANTGSLSGIHLPHFGRSHKYIRKEAPEDTFATIFHSELLSQYKTGDYPNGANVTGLVSTLKSMEAAGIKSVMYSVNWGWMESVEGRVKYDYLDMLASAACDNTNLKVYMIVDLLNAPPWLFNKYPEAASVDASGRNYTHLSFYHQAGNALAQRLLEVVVMYLSKQFPGCATHIQPVYNNEYEAKYTQEYDMFRDYSPHALKAYRAWMKERMPRLEMWNERWVTAFHSWEDVKPPTLTSGDLMGIDDNIRYWDFMRFREKAAAGAFNDACRVVVESGLKCFHHFPEFFSVLDAMYGAGIFKHLAVSPYVDFLIMDSNFKSPYGTKMNVEKLRLYVSAAVPYGKPIYFEAAVEVFAGAEMIRNGYTSALMSGAANLGITNWLSRVPMDNSLHQAMRTPPPCRADEVVGVFIHLDSCASWHGVQWHRPSKDPLHDFIEELAGRLSVRCETDIVVFIELERFAQHMNEYDRVVFVEPLVVLGEAQLQAYSEIKAALPRMRHEVLQMPANSTTGIRMQVLQDM